MRAVLAFAALAGAVHAQEGPSQFAYRAPIAAQAGASHYRFALPAAVYEGARRDLADLRVFNAAGEPVPYAFVPREAPKPPSSAAAVKLFPLYGDPSRSLDATTVRVERNARGTVVSVNVQNGAPPRRRALVGYLLDAAHLERPLEALRLDWQTPESFSGQVRVEASDDLKAWRTVVGASPVLELEHDGARLERRRVELGGARARYLRVSFRGVPAAFRLAGARVELRPEQAEPEREWRALAGAEGKRRGEWSYDSGGHFPADRVRLRLPQPNTVAQVAILTREGKDDAWRRIGAAVAYRLSRGGAEIANPDIAVRTSAERYWRVEVEQKGGGIGAGELGLEIGWVPREMVFAARGAGPFELAYGNAEAKSGALPVGAVLPRRGDGAEAMLARPARVGAAMAKLAEPPSLLSEPLRFVRELEAGRAKKWLLWLVLVAGVGLLAWMAFRLLHEVDTGQR